MPTGVPAASLRALSVLGITACTLPVVHGSPNEAWNAYFQQSLLSFESLIRNATTTYRSC